MESKLEANSYETLDQFIYDAKLIFKNCRQYNDGGSNCASPLSRVLVVVWLSPRARAPD